MELLKAVALALMIVLAPMQHIATLPTVMRLPEPLHSASIGNSHTILVMRSGRMMSVGNNGRHQTGVPTQDQQPVNTYTYIETPTPSC